MVKQHQNSSKYILISIVILVVAAIVVTFFLSSQKHSPQQSQPITLSAEMYGKTEIIDIDKAQYEQMMTEEKSFVLMVDNPGCITTAKMREMLESFSDSLKFSYYRIMWSETENTNIRDFVKYFPSMMTIDHGKISAYLQADSDSDTTYYNDASALQTWLTQHVNFPDKS